MSLDTTVTAVTIAEGSIRGSTFSAEGREVSCFLGIPYAGSPAGKRRFLPPLPAVGWTGVRDCTVPGPAAPQNPEVPAPPGRKPRTWSESECLNLNVWTPDVGGSGLPVMVWIHGGAYVSGAGSDAMYDGGNLAGATGTVVVTLNYRLGALGFLHLAELLGPGYEDSSNLALLDQLEALRFGCGAQWKAGVGSRHFRHRLPAAQQPVAGCPARLRRQELLVSLHLAQPCLGREAGRLPRPGHSVRVPATELTRRGVPHPRNGAAEPERHDERRVGRLRPDRGSCYPGLSRLAGIRPRPQDDDP